MLKIASKDLLLFFKDKKAIFLTFLLPLGLATLFVFAYGGVKTVDKKEYILPVADEDQTAASKNAIAVLDTHQTLTINEIALDTALESIKKGKSAAVLVLHKGFSDSLNAGASLPVEIFYDQAEKVQVDMLQQALISTFSMLPYSKGEFVYQAMKKRNSEIAHHDSALEKQLNNQFDNYYNTLTQGITAQTSSQKISSVNMFQSIKMTSVVKENSNTTLALIQAVVGTTILMLLFSVTGMASGLLDEKQEGTLKKLLYSPVSASNLLQGKMLAANVVSIVQLLFMFVFAWLVFGLDIMSHIPALLLMIVATSYACSGFGVFLASVARTRQQVQGLSMFIILVMSAIGGSMMPLFFMPQFMQEIAVFSLNYWGIQGFFDIFWRKLSFFDPTFLSRVGVLFLIGLVLYIVASRLFKRNVSSML